MNLEERHNLITLLQAQQFEILNKKLKNMAKETSDIFDRCNIGEYINRCNELLHLRCEKSINQGVVEEIKMQSHDK